MHTSVPFRDRLLRSRVSAAVTGALLVCAVSLTGCGGSDGTPGGDDSKVLTVGLSGEPQPLKVGINQNSVGYTMDALLMQGLLRWDKNGKIENALAESYEKVDNATYTFTLRPGLTFSDGSPLTSADVKRTFEFLADPVNSAYTVAGMSRMGSIITDGDLKLTVKLKENDPDFPSYVANPTAFIVKGDELGKDVTIGAGPFVVEKKANGISMDLVPNKKFYDPDRVKLERIVLKYYTDTTARTNALLGGDVDFMDYPASQDFKRLKSAPGIVLDAQPAPLMTLTFNLAKKTPFSDPLVRQALAFAVDRDHVASAAEAGEADPVYGPVLAKDSPFATKKSQSLYSYDPEKAKKLLAEAGYPDGFDATILTNSQYPYHQDTALAVQDDLKKVGINLTLDSGDYATYVKKATAGDYEIKTTAGAGLIEDASYLESWYFANAAYTSLGYKNDELRAALMQGRTEASEEGRAAAYDKAFDIVAVDPPRVDLIQRYNGFAHKDTVQGFKNVPGFLSLFSMNELPYLSVGG